MKQLPFIQSQIQQIIKDYPTPFYLYDEKGIRLAAKNLSKAFSWAPKFKNYFAVKTTPNPHLLKILQEEGFGADCSSFPELVIAEKVGVTGENIMFSSNDTPYHEFKKAFDLGAIINLDDITHIPILEKYAGIPAIISFRYNPGPLRQHKGNTIIGKPEDAKFGMTKEQLFQAYKTMKQKGITRFGLHTMIVSNELDPQAVIETAHILFDIVVAVSKNLGIRFEFVDLGGGIGIPYKDGDQPMDLEFVSDEIKKLYEQKIVKNNLDPLSIFMENGRIITGPHGYLVTTAIHKKEIYKNYIGVDASMAHLMRPALYGAYHAIVVLGKEDADLTHVYDVSGSICENLDKLAIDRKLPKIVPGDILVFCNAGAYGYAMGFNFNGKLRSAELLLQADGKVKLIRRAETVEDYLATLDFSFL